MVLDLYAVRDATDFVHPLQPRYGWWEHVPATIFQGQAYIRWEGYLRVDTPGTWVFRVEKTDGLVMLIDGDYAIMSRGCKGEVSSMTTKNELSEGLHPITLLIYTNRNAFALVVEVKKPGETEFHAFSESMLTHLDAAYLLHQSEPSSRSNTHSRRHHHGNALGDLGVDGVCRLGHR